MAGQGDCPVGWTHVLTRAAFAFVFQGEDMRIGFARNNIGVSRRDTDQDVLVNSAITPRAMGRARRRGHAYFFSLLLPHAAHTISRSQP
jgi:hypothetical protein